jgi:predicted Fe-S protein YdhL (DUF1289 family)
MTPIPHVPVPSPCNNICRMEPDRSFCVGCRRSLAEIAGWATMNDEAKSAVWALLPARRGPAAAPGVSSASA